MANCCVGGCTKKYGSPPNGMSDFRRFIRFYRFPKEKAMQKKWIARVFRRRQDINPQSMYVCSDHFEDDDFDFHSLQKAELFSQERLKGLKVLLKKDAVPNTDRSTGIARKGRPPAKKALKRPTSHLDSILDPPCSNTNTSLAISPNSRSAKRPCRFIDVENLDELIAENQRLLEVGQIDTERAAEIEIIEEQVQLQVQEQVQTFNQFSSSCDSPETDKSVQVEVNVPSTTRGIQVGGPSSFLPLFDPLVDENNCISPFESVVLIEHRDCSPQVKPCLAKLNLNCYKSFKKKTKTFLPFSVYFSKVIGEIIDEKFGIKHE